MHPLVNHLIQLQELTLIRDEQITHKRTDRLDQLDHSISGLTAELPPDVRQTFMNLQRKNHIVIVPVSNGVCAACGMRLPISLVQSVRSADTVQHCPTCVRMLYFPESPVRHVAKAPRRSEPQRVGVSRFSSHSLMIPELASTERDVVIRELAMKMQTEGFVDTAERLVDQALARETICSTTVDHGIAFPHARGVEGGGLTLALGLSSKGIKFDDNAKNLTKLVFFMVIPTAASAFYLKLIAGLAETFMDAEARKKLFAENEPEKLWKAFVKATRSTIP
jgi:mannitol/fructose-specific phosphotransferase system IIA component (Ntr-type)